MSTHPEVNKNDDIWLQKLAEEELIREAKIAAARVETSGTRAWQKYAIPKTNKRFINNMILNTLSSKSTVKMKAKENSNKKIHT